MRKIHDTEFPNSVEATEALLIEQSLEYTKLKVRICEYKHRVSKASGMGFWVELKYEKKLQATFKCCRRSVNLFSIG